MQQEFDNASKAASQGPWALCAFVRSLTPSYRTEPNKKKSEILFLLCSNGLSLCCAFKRGPLKPFFVFQEEMNRGKPNWEHLSEDLHVLITVEDTHNRAKIKLQRAINEVKKLLVPAVSISPNPSASNITGLDWWKSCVWLDEGSLCWYAWKGEGDCQSKKCVCLCLFCVFVCVSVCMREYV